MIFQHCETYPTYSVIPPGATGYLNTISQLEAWKMFVFSCIDRLVDALAIFSTSSSNVSYQKKSCCSLYIGELYYPVMWGLRSKIMKRIPIYQPGLNGKEGTIIVFSWLTC